MELRTFLTNSLAVLFDRWQTYRRLVQASQKERAALSRAAPGLWWLLVGLLVDDVQLSICRMLDHAQMPHDNATFEQLIKQLNGDAQYAGLDSILGAAKTLATGIRERRHKQLAHADLLVATGQAPAVKTPFDDKDVDECLAKLAEILNAIRSHNGEDPIDFAQFRSGKMTLDQFLPWVLARS